MHHDSRLSQRAFGAGVGSDTPTVACAITVALGTRTSADPVKGMSTTPAAIGDATRAVRHRA
jgi:hypothetical protein